MMKFATAALVLLFGLSAPALAGACDAEITALKAQLASSQAQPDVKTQVQDMATQAEQLCEAGNEKEAADVLADASALLMGQ